MNQHALHRCSWLLAGWLVTVVFPNEAAAQLSTQHVKGSAGLKAGSQPPPGGYAIAPLLYFYKTDTIKTANGATLPIAADLDIAFFGAGYSHVTGTKILGASYGYTVMFPLGADNRIQGTEIEFATGVGLTDSVLAPVSLGWHHPRADTIASFTVYAPTGRYRDGARNNTGLGMWGFEPSAGTTVYLDTKRQFHAATLASFNVQTEKEGGDTTVGNQVNLEGGFGADFLKGGLTTGLVYYAAFKVSDDEIAGLPGILIRGRNRTFALGPEATLAIALRDKVRGFVTARYFWETYARTTTKGGAFLLQATFLTKPIPLPQ